MSTKPTKIDELADRAGSMTKLREIMGNVPWTTIGRWNRTLREEGADALPRSAKQAIRVAEAALDEKEKADGPHA